VDALRFDLWLEKFLIFALDKINGNCYYLLVELKQLRFEHDKRKNRSMITNDPIVSHQLVEGYECPECGYDSVYDAEEPIEEEEDDED